MCAVVHVAGMAMGTAGVRQLMAGTTAHLHLVMTTWDISAAHRAEPGVVGSPAALVDSLVDTVVYTSMTTGLGRNHT